MTAFAVNHGSIVKNLAAENIAERRNRMKLLDIAYKDMLRYFRSALAVGFMLVIPLSITGLIYFAFGGVLTSSETSDYTLPVIQIEALNLDSGDAQSGTNLGQQLIAALSDESVADVFALTTASDAAAARAAVDRQEAALALIIPANFTQAAITGSDTAQVEIYQDPTLSFGPGITKEVVGQFLDALSGGRIATRVMADQLSAEGLSLDPADAAQVQAAYGEWFRSLASEKQWNLPVVKRLPNKAMPKSIADHRTTLLGPVFAGMMVFFVFFTGANTAQSILKEQEEGTLARLFTTPTPLHVILGGKFAAVFLTLIVQSIVLTVVSAILFQIAWGNLVSLALMLVGLVVAGAGFGILLMSFLKSDRQAGAVSGGVLALMGMASGLFSAGFASGPTFLDTLGLAMPQGWAMRGLKLVLSGAAPQDVLVPLAVLLAFGSIFFAAGSRVFSRRFA
jgi:ABC-2 type transport system permease protein